MSHYQKLNVVISETQTDTVNGLTSQEAQSRLLRDGENVLAGKKKKTIIQRFFEQFKDTMVIILLFAAFLSLAIAIYNHLKGLVDEGALLEEYLEPVIIMLIVVLNAVLGTVQESKAEKSLEALQKLSAPHVRVMRDGTISILEVSQVVVGDIILVEAGDMVPADARLIESASLRIDESALTGESVPVEKDYLTICSENSAIGDRTNMIFSSCPVSYGRAKAVVTATGMKTEIGKIASMLAGEEQTKTPLQLRLTSLSKYLGLICLVVSVIVFAVGVLTGLKNLTDDFTLLDIFMNNFMTAVSLAVAAIPEGLPAIVTIVLARGVSRMVARNAIARKLPAVETLGSASVICSDKTGTLTQNRMTVVKCYSGGNIESMPAVADETKKMIMLAALCCDGTVLEENGVDKHIGDPTETSIIVAARTLGMRKDDLNKKHPRKYEIPFDSDRKLMTTVNQIDDKYYVIVKGAWESLINEVSGKPVNEIQEAVMDMSKEALRVLVVAYKVLDKLPAKFDNGTLEKGLVFAGLIGMIDPPREEVREAVEICMHAGIKPVMITGDHVVTAMAIAKQLGIMRDIDTAITGEELLKMPDAELTEHIDKYAVYARVSPQDKIRIVKAWQEKGAVVAMTGDGVNDAPALKAADIGCAMGITGTDVAKGAADMVLTDDNFATIVDAVEEGRGIFDNIKKAVKYLLGCNLGEILIVFLAMLIWQRTPLIAIQLLWINLVTDGLPALALGMERPEQGIMNRKPKPKSEGFFSHGMGLEIIIYGIFFAAVSLVAYWLGVNSVIPGGFMGPVISDMEIMAHSTGSTMAFLVLSAGQLFFALEMRTNRSMFADSPINNKYMIGAFLISFGLIMLVAFVPGIARVFGLTQLSGDYYGYALILALGPLVLQELIYLGRFIVNKIRNKG